MINHIQIQGNILMEKEGLIVDERAAFDNWRKEYHAYLAKKELEARGIKVKCK
jgi:hypothetical protein